MKILHYSPIPPTHSYISQFLTLHYTPHLKNLVCLKVFEKTTNIHKRLSGDNPDVYTISYSKHFLIESLFFTFRIMYEENQDFIIVQREDCQQIFGLDRNNKMTITNNGKGYLLAHLANEMRRITMGEYDVVSVLQKTSATVKL